MKKKNSKMMILIMVICVLLDQITKYIVTVNMALADTIQIVKNFFRITYVQNTGAAWSFMAGNRIFFILITFMILVALLYMLIKKENLSKKEGILFGILIGGILGNMIDRILYGYVIDFLDFNFGGYDFPVFNVADTLIVLSGILIMWMYWKEEK